MKWVTLLKDIKEKVGLTQSPSSSASPSAVSYSSPPPSSSSRDSNALSAHQGSLSSPERSNIFFFFFSFCFKFFSKFIIWNHRKFKI